MRTTLERILLVAMAVAMGGSFSLALWGADYYVAPDGSPRGDGSRERPWDLQTVLSGKLVGAGSTVWVTGGTYRGAFTSYLKGRNDAPITLRVVPGQRAVLDGHGFRGVRQNSVFAVFGEWTNYIGLEITGSETDRQNLPNSSFGQSGFDIFGSHVKLINLVVHDTGEGNGFWADAVDSELYGSIIFNCGTQNNVNDQRHGHGIYTQNDRGTKTIRDNIIFNQFGWGLHAWPAPGDVKGYDIEGNAFFNNGVLSRPTQVNNNVFVGSHAPFHPERIQVANNYTYDFPKETPGEKFYEAGVCLLCTDTRPQAGDDLTVQDNYFVGGTPVLAIGSWQSIVMSANTFVGQKGFVAFAGSETVGGRQFRWEQNRYFGAGLDYGEEHHIGFLAENRVLEFHGWSEKTGLDRNSSFSPELPTGVDIFVRPNQYEPGRANIIVYNWKRQERVDVDLRAVLKPGDHFVVLNVQDYLGEPVLAGIYDGRPVSLPMTGLKVAVPMGRSTAPLFTGPEFAVFVVRTDAGRMSSPENGQYSPASPTSAGSEDLSKFVGYFATPDGRDRAKVSVDSGRLVLTIFNEPGHPSYLLGAESGTRFRIQGAPAGFFANFEMTQQRAASLTIERGQAPSVRLFPQPSSPEK